jgi:hypothetical protein
MISTAIKEKLLGIIKEKMIPEYKKLETCREEIKVSFLKYLDEVYLTERDKRLIEKNPDCIRTSDHLLIAGYYYSDKDIKFTRLEHSGYTDMMDGLTVKLEEPIPQIVTSVVDLKVDKEAWRIVGPSVNKYCRVWNTFAEKYNSAVKFVNHKNTTLTMIKDDFPELYKLYKGGV